VQAQHRRPLGTHAVAVRARAEGVTEQVARVRLEAGRRGAASDHATQALCCGASVALGVSFWEVQSVMSDPCKAGKNGVDPWPTVADLAQHLPPSP